MVSLYLRNLFFTIVHPGLVVGLIPYWILDDGVKRVETASSYLYQYAGVTLGIIGLVILLHCIFRFAVKGRGTLSPLDPTKHLVINGFYTYSRNPMYVGVMMMLIAEALFFESANLVVYSGIVFIIFNIFIITVEEPRLRRDFGDEYLQYCQKVRRWI